jgi:hypothetical protein
MFVRLLDSVRDKDGFAGDDADDADDGSHPRSDATPPEWLLILGLSEWSGLYSLLVWLV